MENDANIRYRVVTGVTSTRGDPPLLKLAHAFLALSKTLEGGPAASHVSQYSSFCSEIRSIESQIKRHAAVQEACNGEVERYAAKQEGIESAICAAEAAIDHDKAALNEAQNHRANIEEYEIKKGGIMKHASKAASTAEHQRVLGDVAAVQADCGQADRTAQLRKRQFAMLLHVLEMVRKGISEGLTEQW